MARRNRIVAVAVGLAFAIAALGFALRLVPQRGEVAPTVTTVDNAAPQDADFDRLFHAGIEFLRAGRASEAVEAFAAAVALRPHVPEAQADLGFALIAANDPAAAQAAFSRAIDINVGQTNAYFGLAEAMDMLGDRAAALGAMRSYVHLAKPEDPYRRRAMAAIWEWEVLAGQEAIQHDGPDSVRALAALPTAEAGNVSPASIGERALIVNVWATWCAPCRTELPSLQALSEKLDPKVATVVGLSTDRDGDFVREFLREAGVQYVNHVDPGRKVAYGLYGVDSYPLTLLIGADGKIKRRVLGARDWAAPDMTEAIQSAIPGAIAAVKN